MFRPDLDPMAYKYVRSILVPTTISTSEVLSRYFTKKKKLLMASSLC